MKQLSDNGQYNFDACVAMAVIATVAVVLRFAIRYSSGQLPSPSEWLCLLSLLFLFAYVGIMIHYIVYGSVNGNFNVITFRAKWEVVSLLKMIYMNELIFSCGITAVKISILCFYYTIFAISRPFRRVVIIAGVICLLWLIIMCLVVTFQCRPIHAFWDMMGSSEFCIPSAKLILGYEISNLFVDVGILCLPVAMVRTLQLPTPKKVLVGGIFLLGGFVCIASIMRVSYIWNPPNPEANVNLPMTLFWSSIQIGLAIVCSCLPTYGSIYRSATFTRAFERIKSSLYSSRNSSRKGKSAGSSGLNGSSRQNEEYSRLSEQARKHSLSSTHAPSAPEVEYAMEPVPPSSVLASHHKHAV